MTVLLEKLSLDVFTCDQSAAACDYRLKGSDVALWWCSFVVFCDRRAGHKCIRIHVGNLLVLDLTTNIQYPAGLLAVLYATVLRTTLLMLSGRK